VHLLTRGGRNKRELDIAGLIEILAQDRLTHAFVEQVGAMPGQGVSGVFAFGKCYGLILAVLAAGSFPLSLVLPVSWSALLVCQKLRMEPAPAPAPRNCCRRALHNGV
jgi:hypothetical protein